MACPTGVILSRVFAKPSPAHRGGPQVGIGLMIFRIQSDHPANSASASWIRPSFVERLQDCCAGRHHAAQSRSRYHPRATVESQFTGGFMRQLVRLSLALAAVCALQAAVKLPALISDHMVLQQGMPVRIWGTAEPGETVRVEFQWQSVSAKAGANGKWSAWLKPLVAAGPLSMTIAGTNTITIQDVLVGEVWLGSGQSNMEFKLQAAVNHEEEVAHAGHPMIHIFQVKRAIAEQ